MAISVGSVEVDVVPNTQGIYNRLRDGIVPAATRAGEDAGTAAGRAFGPAMAHGVSDSVADAVGQRIGQQIGQRISTQIRDSIGDGITAGGRRARPAATRQGDETAGAFARSLKARLEAAFKSMPKLNVGLNDTGVDADLARLRARLETLAGKTIGIDVDAEAARAEAADIEERLRRIGAAHPNVAVRADTAAAITQLQLLREEIDSVSRDPAHIRVEVDGGFGARLRAAVQAAEASLPNVNINADTTPAQVEVARLRAVLTSLADARIGIDIDSGAAMAQITEVQARLARLSASNADVAVRVDAGAALAQLTAFQAAVNRLDGQEIDIDARTATADLQLLTTAALAFGPALLPVLPIAAAGLGAIAASAAAAGAGLGAVALVAVPAFKQIAGVLQAQKQAQDAATTASIKGSQAGNNAAQQAIQQASAQQALATAERNGARQIAQAQQQVVQARQAAAQAVQQAAQQNEQAERRVQDAERSLADAQVAARQAQQDLTAARKQAAQELEDLNNQLADSVLSQRDAEIQLTEATAQRDAVLKNANATELDKQKALLAYDQAVQRLKEQTTETSRLKTETAAANKAGVAGSATYTAAQDRLAQAQRNVADQQQAVRDAQAEAARVQVQTAQQVAQAQQRVSEATANVAVAQQNAADSVASAQRQIQSASLSAAGTVDQAAVAQTKYQQALAGLTPAARDTFNAFVNLKTAFGDWSRSLQPAVMPIFTRALNGLAKVLPRLTPFVYAAADAVKDLQDRFSKNIKTPFWQHFVDDLQKNVRPAIVGFGIAFGNIFTGMAGIVDGFLPHMGGISDTMQRITGKFANWGKGLKGSPEFENFLDYVSTNGPILADTLGKFFNALFSIGKALSPLSGPMLQVLGGIADFVATVATTAPGLIQVIYGMVLAWRVFAIVMAAVNLVMDANPFTLIVLAIVALIGIVVWAYKRFGWFRDGVHLVWAGIQTAVQAVVDWFSGPFKRFFTVTIPGVLNSLLGWVKKHWPWILGALTGPIGLAVVYIVKHWGDIEKGVSAAWGWIKKNVLYPIRDFFTVIVPGWAGKLKNHVLDAFVGAQQGIKTAWDKIEGIAKKPIAFVVNTVYNDGLRKVWNLVTDAFGGKHLAPMKFATGGIMPGYTPGRDVHLVPSVAGPVALSGGEAIMRPEWTRAVGPDYVNSMNAAARQGGVQGVRGMLGFKDGGIFSGVGSFLSGAWDKVKKGASWLKDTFGAAVRAGAKKVVNPLIDRIPGGHIGLVTLLKSLMKNAVQKLLGAGKKGDDLSASSIGGVIPTGKRLAVISQALAAAHVPPPGTLAQWQRGLNTLITRESGWNASAVNRWDINAKQGHPSQGLAQTIPSTFNHYVPASLRSRGILDPVANVAAAIRYIVSRYGNITRVQQANANKPPAGYDSGGYLQPGLNLAYNGTGKPEPVFTTAQANALTSLAARPGQQDLGDLHVQVFVGDREITDIARAEVRDSQQQLIRVLNVS